MPIMFNSILREAGILPNHVRLVRHKDNRTKKGHSLYELWRDNRPLFEEDQSRQSVRNRNKLTTDYWAVFVANTDNETLFAGLYSVKYIGVIVHEIPLINRNGVDEGGTVDRYELTLQDALSDLIGKLIIDWGSGLLAWVQYADRHDKPVKELRIEFKEPDFPGFLNFIQPLSKLENMPASWVAALKSSRGVYLLTCPKTLEQYVGSASGEGGFWGRWQNYIDTGHGGNVALRSREPSDYQVSILEVAGSSATTDDILSMEGRWQSKLQSRDMGLNRNWAG